jgi:hypothetical protein
VGRFIPTYFYSPSTFPDDLTWSSHQLWEISRRGEVVSLLPETKLKQREIEGCMRSTTGLFYSHWLPACGEGIQRASFLAQEVN